MIYSEIITYECQQAEYHIERRLRRPWGAPSGVGPGVLPVHVLGTRGAVNRRRELDDQPDGLDHGLNPIKSSNHSA